MRGEVSGSRPSTLSSLFRKWTDPGGPLADWTRHLDSDWKWYCPECGFLVVVIEEKHDDSLQTAWTVTKRAAIRHLDRPWGWRVTCHDSGEFSVVGERDERNIVQERRMSEETLLAWITRAFEKHGQEHGCQKRVKAVA